MQIYGNLMNRLEENKNFCGREIKAGDDITEYMWSDRYCYYVTEVDDQKRIKVLPYQVCADQDKAGGMGHQDWMYFKTKKEMYDYLRKYHPERYPDDFDYEEEKEQTWVFRYGKWKREHVFTKENYCTEAEKKSLAKKGYYKRYSDLSGNISFGVRNYHYDWEF